MAVRRLGRTQFSRRDGKLPKNIDPQHSHPSIRMCKSLTSFSPPPRWSDRASTGFLRASRPCEHCGCWPDAPARPADVARTESWLRYLRSLFPPARARKKTAGDATGRRVRGLRYARARTTIAITHVVDHPAAEAILAHRARVACPAPPPQPHSAIVEARRGIGATDGSGPTRVAARRSRESTSRGEPTRLRARLTCDRQPVLETQRRDG